MTEQMTDLETLIELLGESLPPNESELFSDQIRLFCSDIVKGDQITLAVPKIDLRCRDRLWLHRLAEQLVDLDGVDRTPEQRQVEISYRIIDLAVWLGITKGYDLSQLLNNPSDERVGRFWRHR